MYWYYSRSKALIILYPNSISADSSWLAPFEPYSRQIVRAIPINNCFLSLYWCADGEKHQRECSYIIPECTWLKHAPILLVDAHSRVVYACLRAVWVSRIYIRTVLRSVVPVERSYYFIYIDNFATPHSVAERYSYCLPVSIDCAIRRPLRST